MRLSVFLCASAGALATAVPHAPHKRTISDDLYADLLWYWKYADSTGTNACPHPNGNTLVTEFQSNVLIDTEGLIARDDDRKEIIVSFRGSTDIQNYISDFEIVLVPFVSPGVTPPPGTFVHTGFITAFNAVATPLLANVTALVAAYPSYALIPLGHSLGGALASIAAVSFAQHFPSADIRLYTFGQPRTGNPVYAEWVNDVIGSNAFRVTHTKDCVPQLIGQALGYAHHGVEYWNFQDPSAPANFVQCAPDGEDPTCQDSVGRSNTNCTDHLTYMGIPTETPFCK